MKKEPYKKNMKQPGCILLLILLIFLTGNVFSQQVTPSVICSGGETFTTSSLTLDFTIGEIATETLSGNGVLLTQGFNQNIIPNLGIEEEKVNSDDITIYPNPVSDRLCLLFNGEKTKPVKVKINDLGGRVVFSQDFNNNPLIIHPEKLEPGFYTVTVVFDNHLTINKKIIKQ